MNLNFVFVFNMMMMMRMVVMALGIDGEEGSMKEGITSEMEDHKEEI